MSDKTYIAIDLKSFYASVECMERGLDPMTTNLVVADASRTETDRFFSSGWRTESKSRFSCRLCGGTAADGTLYENQCQDL